VQFSIKTGAKSWLLKRWFRPHVRNATKTG